MSMSYEEILQGMLNKVPGDVDKREGSVIYDALAPCAYFLAQQNFQMDNFINLVFADSAVEEYLDRAVAAFGVERKAATAAVRKMVTSAEVSLGTRWGISGIVFVLTSELSKNAYEAICETVGEIGNQYSGAMQPISNVAGISAELQDIISAGADEETDEALRERFFQKVRLPATSGNAYHYKLWALDVPGVGDAKVFPLDNGPGTVTVLVVDSDKKKDVTLEMPVHEHIESVRPIGVSVTVGSPSETIINVTADVILDGSQRNSDVIQAFKLALTEYLKGLVFHDYRVSYAKVGSLLLSTGGVADYNNLKLNGLATNIIIDAKAVPAMGAVDLSEVSAFGID